MQNLFLATFVDTTACISLVDVVQVNHHFLFYAMACRDDSWQTVTHAKGVCALYGVCGHRQDRSGLDCPDNLPGSPLDNPAMQKLQNICPQLASEYGTDGQYCCTEEQIDTLTHQVCQEPVQPFLPTYVVTGNMRKHQCMHTHD